MLTLVGTTSQGPIARDANGVLYIGRDDGRGLSGLSGFNWERLERAISPIIGGVGTWIASKGQPKVPEYYAQPPGGAYVQAGGGGLMGGIDTNTLLLIGGGIALVFLATKK